MSGNDDALKRQQEEEQKKKEEEDRKKSNEQNPNVSKSKGPEGEHSDSSPEERGSGIFYKFDHKELGKLKIDLETNNVATKEQLQKISKIWANLGVPEAEMAKAAFDIAYYCKNVGSSAQTKIAGQSSVVKTVSREEMVAGIKSVCTLRQFCMFYAKPVWQKMLMTKDPPANYTQKGFPEEVKYAAFDFFSGVNNPAAIDVVGGLSRKPTNQEMTANLTSKEVMIHRQIEKEGNQALNVGEVTGGVKGPKARIGIRHGVSPNNS